jgi:DNA-binding XRE family transcriptional regulator
MSEIGKVYPLGPRALEPRAPEPRAPEPRALEPLWREILGYRLRALRAGRGETLAQTAERAGISPQYLSEIERGRKEASSEMIAALAGALDVSVADLMAGTAEDLRQAATSFIVITSAAAVSGRVPGAAGGLGPVQRPSGPVALASAA